MAEWDDETKFNAKLRRILKAQGFGVTHIREADEQGVFDLLVWKGRRMEAWVELKVRSEPMRESQTIWARKPELAAIPLMVARAIGPEHQVVVQVATDGDWHELTIVKAIDDYRTVWWASVFEEQWARMAGFK
jgi:hypothetical protein